MALATTKSHPISLPSLYPKTHLIKQLFTTSPSCSALFYRATTSLPKRVLIKCGGGGSYNSPDENKTGNSLRESLAGMVEKEVEELLNKEENKDLLAGLQKASERVEMAKRELAEIERQELEAKQLRSYINQLEGRASEIAESQREISEARAMIEEAERSLSLGTEGDVDGDALQSQRIDRDVERLESIKAGFISATGGTLAGLPIFLAQVTSNEQLLLSTAISFICCLLFGVTFRYAVRRDLDNIQLKTGTAAAFGFVKGLATLEGGPPLELNIGSFLSNASEAGVLISENLLIFLFASVSLDFCFKTGLLSPFPMRSSNTK